MHYTEEQAAKARIGEELQRRGWTLLGYMPSSGGQLDDYAPAYWDGVATNDKYPGIVLGVKVVRWKQVEGWPTFQSTPKGKAWHIERESKILYTGTGLNRCTGYTTGYAGRVEKFCDAIESATKRAYNSEERLQNTTAAAVEQITIEHHNDGTWVFFPAKPEKAVRMRLKQQGFWWKSEANGWHSRHHVDDAALAWLTAPEGQLVPAESPLEVARQLWEDHRPKSGVSVKRMAYDYVPDWLRAAMPRLYSQDGVDDPIVWLKLFLPEGRWTFYATEFSATAPDGVSDLMFGYLLSALGDDCDEWCYMSLAEITEMRSAALRLPVERDLWWMPAPFSAIKARLDKSDQEFKATMGPDYQTLADCASDIMQREGSPCTVIATGGEITTVITPAWLFRQWSIYKGKILENHPDDEAHRATFDKAARQMFLGGEWMLSMSVDFRRFCRVVIQHALLGQTSRAIWEQAYRDGADFTPGETWKEWEAYIGKPTKQLTGADAAALIAEAQAAVSIPQIQLAFADDGSTVSFSNAEYRIAAEYVVRGGNWYSPGWKVHRREGDGWVIVEGDKPNTSEEWKKSLALDNAIGQLIKLTQNAVCFSGKPNDLPDSYLYISEDALHYAQAHPEPAKDTEPAALPDGWAADDIRGLLDALKEGPILVAETKLGIPTLDSMNRAGKVEHLGYGCFEIVTPQYILTFDGGGALERTPSGRGYCHLGIRGDYPYDIEGVRTKLEAWLQVAEAAESPAEESPELAQVEPAQTPAPTLEPFSITLEAWLDNEHHEIWRSGGDMHYIRSDGQRTLWAGITSRHEVIVRQHYAEVQRCLIERRPIAVDVLRDYPDLFVQATKAKLVVPANDEHYRPVWERTRHDYSVSYPMSYAGGVPIGKVDRTKEQYHEIVVRLAVERGYPAPQRVLESYPELKKADQPEPAVEQEAPAAPEPPAQVAEPQAADQADTGPTEADVAEYTSRWNVYFETGAVATVKKTVQRITNTGVLQVALSRVDRGNPTTLEERRKAIESRIKQLQKLPKAA